MTPTLHNWPHTHPRSTTAAVEVPAALPKGLRIPTGLRSAYEALRRDPFSNWNIEGWNIALQREPPKVYGAWRTVSGDLSRFYKGKTHAGAQYDVTRTGLVKISRTNLV